MTGCVSSHKPALVYYTPAVTVPTPTSQSDVVRVYPGPAAPLAVRARRDDNEPVPLETADIAIARSISIGLKSDPDLAGASRRVEATVDGGVVTLRGKVAAEHERDEIVQIVSSVPGVSRVEDHIGVDLR